MKKHIIILGALLLFMLAFRYSAFAENEMLKKDSSTELQQTLPYSRNLPQTFPDFKYEPANDAPLMHLRKKYALM